MGRWRTFCFQRGHISISVTCRARRHFNGQLQKGIGMSLICYVIELLGPRRLMEITVVSWKHDGTRMEVSRIRQLKTAHFTEFGEMP